MAAVVNSFFLKLRIYVLAANHRKKSMDFALFFSFHRFIITKLSQFCGILCKMVKLFMSNVIWYFGFADKAKKSGAILGRIRINICLMGGQYLD